MGPNEAKLQQPESLVVVEGAGGQFQASKKRLELRILSRIRYDLPQFIRAFVEGIALGSWHREQSGPEKHLRQHRSFLGFSHRIARRGVCQTLVHWTSFGAAE
ncbi:MAG TPA: hypothetical protein VEH04_00045 [Verrucomicrobiae bacterium]|nr:hypothetical protein [Verrucomicrobiae bacterium]